MFEIGQVVYSKNGRYKGQAFIVVSSAAEFVYLADGNTRKLERPKKKKQRHVQPTKVILADIQTKLARNVLLDAEIRSALLDVCGTKKGV